MADSYKSSLDRLVSEAAGVSMSQTAKVTTALYAVLLDQLVRAGEVTIPGLGTLRVFTAQVNRKVNLCRGVLSGNKHKTTLHVGSNIRIYFSKAVRLRTALKENGYGEVRS